MTVACSPSASCWKCELVRETWIWLPTIDAVASVLTKVSPAGPVTVVTAAAAEVLETGRRRHAFDVEGVLDRHRQAGQRSQRVTLGAVIVDPHDANIVFVAALGHTYGPNSERGIFRSRDGGRNWEKVLYKDDKTGGIDIVFDPEKEKVLKWIP